MFGALRWAVLGDAHGRALVLDGLKSLVDHGLAEPPCLAVLSAEPAPSDTAAMASTLLPEHLNPTSAPRVVPSAEALWQSDQDPPPIDIVADAEPLRAAQGLARGWHVLLDWPESVDLATARAWRDQAAERGVHLAAAAWPRHSATLAMLHWSLEAEVLGALSRVSLGACGGPVELAQAVALVDWLCGPLDALRMRDGGIEARLAGGAEVTLGPGAGPLTLTGERGRYQAGWLRLEGSGQALARWFALTADAATQERLFPHRLADTTGRALGAFLTGLTRRDPRPTHELLRTTLIADIVRESSYRDAMWLAVPAGAGD